MSPPVRKTPQQWIQLAREVMANDPAAGLAHAQRALDQDPALPPAWYYRGFCLRLLSRFEEAAASFGRAAELDGGSAAAVNGTAACLLKIGRYAAAIEMLEKLEDPPFHIRLTLVDAFKAMGDAPKAYERILALEGMAASESASDRGLYWYNRACYECLLERDADAFGSLAKALALAPRYKESAGADPDFVRLRDDSRFLALLR